MTEPNVTDAFLIGLLHRLMSRHGGTQVFLFGGDGDPFWAARTPLHQSELRLLSDALDLIERLEKDRPKPFIGHDPNGRFTFAALDGRADLYVVVFAEGPDREAAEARVVAMRDELLPVAEPIRRLWLRPASSPTDLSVARHIGLQ